VLAASTTAALLGVLVLRRGGQTGLVTRSKPL